MLAQWTERARVRALARAHRDRQTDKHNVAHRPIGFASGKS